MALADALAPIYAAARPAARRDCATRSPSATDLWDSAPRTGRLRDENERLRRWQSIALALDAENAAAARPTCAGSPTRRPPTSPPGSWRMPAGVYAKAVLLSVGPNHGIRKGQIALDERGLVGRVTEVGARTARVLLLTDLNSRIPVILENSRAHAILVGTNGARPRLSTGRKARCRRKASAWSPAPRPAPSRPTCRSASVHFSAANVPEVVPARDARPARGGAASSTTAWAASGRRKRPAPAGTPRPLMAGARPTARYAPAGHAGPAAGHRGARTPSRRAARSC